MELPVSIAKMVDNAFAAMIRHPQHDLTLGDRVQEQVPIEVASEARNELWVKRDDIAYHHPEWEVALAVGYGCAQVIMEASADTNIQEAKIDDEVLDTDVDPDEILLFFCSWGVCGRAGLGWRI